jgi:hypothetical protein
LKSSRRNQSFFSSIISANPATMRIRYFHRLSHRGFVSNSELNADAPAGNFRVAVDPDANAD